MPRNTRGLMQNRGEKRGHERGGESGLGSYGDVDVTGVDDGRADRGPTGECLQDRVLARAGEKKPISTFHTDQVWI